MERSDLREIVLLAAVLLASCEGPDSDTSPAARAPAGRALGTAGSEWWVKVRSGDGYQGWIVTPTEGVDGWDACA